MPRDYRRYEPDQTLLLPPSLREWLPEDHLAFFLSDSIDAMDLSAFEARYGDAGPGNQAFDPRMMLKVLVYAYATGTFSSSWKTPRSFGLAGGAIVTSSPWHEVCPAPVGGPFQRTERRTLTSRARGPAG